MKDASSRVRILVILLALAVMASLCAGCQKNVASIQNYAMENGEGESLERAVIIDCLSPDATNNGIVPYLTRRFGMQGKDWKIDSLSAFRIKKCAYSLVTVQLVRQNRVQRIYFNIGAMLSSGSQPEPCSHTPQNMQIQSDDVLLCGGTGLSVEQAITVNIINHELGVAWEYFYLSILYGKMDKDWQREKQALLVLPGGRHMDKLTVRFPDGKVEEHYFAIDRFFGRSRDKERPAPLCPGLTLPQ